MEQIPNKDPDPKKIPGLLAEIEKKGLTADWTKADDLIKNNPVVVFSKPGCPFCDKTKSLLADIEAKYESLELQWHGDPIQDAMKIYYYRHSTVPAIFINHSLIGGNDHLQAIGKSELRRRLEALGAVKA